MIGNAPNIDYRRSGPVDGPLLAIAIFFALLAGYAFPTPAAAASRAAQSSGFDKFLVDLCANHRILYALVVTGTTAVFGFVMSLVGSWVLRLLRIDRLR